MPEKKDKKNNKVSALGFNSSSMQERSKRIIFKLIIHTHTRERAKILSI